MALKKKQKLFNGKPQSYWEAKAHRLVVENLFDASHRLDTWSLPGEIAHKRLMAIALAEDPVVVAEIIDERNRMSLNFGRIMSEWLPSPNRRKAKKSKTS